MRSRLKKHQREDKVGPFSPCSPRPVLFCSGPFMRGSEPESGHVLKNALRCAAPAACGERSSFPAWPLVPSLLDHSAPMHTTTAALPSWETRHVLKNALRCVAPAACGERSSHNVATLPRREHSLCAIGVPGPAARSRGQRPWHSCRHRCSCRAVRKIHPKFFRFLPARSSNETSQRVSITCWAIGQAHITHYPQDSIWLKLSVRVTGHPDLLEIDNLFTQGSRPGRTLGESADVIFASGCSDWSN